MSNLKTNEQFIDEARKKHGNKYDYSLINYINSKTKVKIVCPIHGVFECLPQLHIKSTNGCPHCVKERFAEQKMIVDKNTSYMIGLFQTDGNLSKGKGNKGKFQLELSKKDEDIIYKLKNEIPYNVGIYNRHRKIVLNNREYNKDFITLFVCSLGFRTFFNECGVPYGKKSKSIKPPLHLDNLSIRDYVRGLYDGDGSLGMSNENIPYVSFTTDSEYVKDFLVEYISNITGKPIKQPNRNKRDNIYNILIWREDAVYMCQEIYYDGCLALDRKYELAKIVKSWERPNDMVVRDTAKRWTPEDDDFILNHEIEESMEYLDRSESSIKMRLWRLEKQ